MKIDYRKKGALILTQNIFQLYVSSSRLKPSECFSRPPPPPRWFGLVGV